MPRCVVLALAALVATGSTAAIGQDAPAAPLGFLPGSRAVQRAAEAQAVAVPTPARAREWLRTLTERPHVAGTPADYDTAVFVRDRLRDWGWQADLVEYEVLLDYPTGAELSITRPEPRDLTLIEAPYPPDKDSADPDAFPAFHGYGASGTATAQVVYANFGRPDDFEALEKRGVDVKGKIVLVRYGAIFRGLKVLNAQTRGAAAVLIFSDPLDDGYAKGDIYPRGPYRPPSAVQRGSVQFLSRGPGDPSTPGGPSIKGAVRLPFDARNGFPLDDPEWERTTGLNRREFFAVIPSLPISYEAAEPILRNLGGDNVPEGWQGGLPLAYHVGPGPVEVKVTTGHDYQIRTIWNVIATLKGSAEPDRWVMVGNHRDAWVYGAVDPSSGTAATLEMCRALGEAARRGWSPRRTILYASWDAEEYGLVGSTEWAEDHARQLDERAVLMLNVDSAVSGPNLDLGGVPSLRDLVLDAAADVTDPRSGKALRALWLDRQRKAWAGQEPVDLAHVLEPDQLLGRSGPPFVPRMSPLGSGSDYTVFVDRLGIPAMDVDFGGHYGVYHSVYDDFFWMEHFGDPEFLTHTTAAKLYTLIAMRAAGAEVLPLRFAAYGEALANHVDDLRRQAERKARGRDDGAGSQIDLPGLPDLARAVGRFQAAAVAVDRAADALAARDAVPAARLSAFNDAAQRVERAFLLPDGLPGRPWFRHAIYAPGLTTGYASWPLPGVRQALEQDDAALRDVQLPALVARIDAATAALRAAERAARAE